MRFRCGSGKSASDLRYNHHPGKRRSGSGRIDSAGKRESVGDRLSGSAHQRRCITKRADNDFAAVLLAVDERDAWNAGRRRYRHAVLVQATDLRRSRSRNSRRFVADLRSPDGITGHRGSRACLHDQSTAQPGDESIAIDGREPRLPGIEFRHRFVLRDHAQPGVSRRRPFPFGARPAGRCSRWSFLTTLRPTPPPCCSIPPSS